MKKFIETFKAAKRDRSTLHYSPFHGWINLDDHRVYGFPIVKDFRKKTSDK